VSSTPALAENRVFDKKFTVAVGTLTIDSDFGEIDVSGSDGNEVVVHVELSGDRNRVEDYDITANSTADEVTVRGRRDENWDGFHWWFTTLEVKYTVQVPRNFHVKVRSSRGDLKMSNFNGSAYAQVSRGGIALNGINGAVHIDASRGDVHCNQLVGNVHVAASRGNIELARIDGPMDVSTSRGDVEVSLINPNRGANVSTSRGNVTITLPREFAADIEAHTSRGYVECDLPLANNERASRQRDEDLSGRLNGGGKLLKVKTSRGDIDIRAKS
jgi:DUF4097 and DUF4098 domain-containing protein YvlB